MIGIILSWEYPNRAELSWICKHQREKKGFFCTLTVEKKKVLPQNKKFPSCNCPEKTFVDSHRKGLKIVYFEKVSAWTSGVFPFSCAQKCDISLISITKEVISIVSPQSSRREKVKALVIRNQRPVIIFSAHNAHQKLHKTVPESLFTISNLFGNSRAHLQILLNGN